MKKFLLSFLLFIFPFLLLLGAIEWYVLFYPSTFNRKANYLKKNISQIQTLILGSSHNQNALNPAFFHSPTINLANAGQDVQIDSALFFNYISQLKSLKQVILEIDYHTMEEKNDSLYFRIPWYCRFYNIELYKVSLLNKFSVYSSSPSFFNKVLLDEINPKKIRYRLNNYGFILNDFPGVMEALKYDSLELAKTAPARLKDKHTNQSAEIFNNNRLKIDAIIQYCLLHKIKVILISTPMYVTYIQNEISEKNRRRKNYIDSLIKLPPIQYYDFENNKNFTVYDFKNDDHLNSNGANKFSKLMDSILIHSQNETP
jgi:hypothetical protein